jgi:site-specific DNA recombinase
LIDGGFFCRGKQNGTCTTPHIHVGRLEEAVEEHYATIRFRPEFLAEVRAHLAKAIDDENAAARLLHDQPTAELKTLDSKEENLLDLAADEEMPKTKIKSRLRAQGAVCAAARLAGEPADHCSVWPCYRPR